MDRRKILLKEWRSCLWVISCWCPVAPPLTWECCAGTAGCHPTQLQEISDDVSDFLFRQLPFFNFLHYLRLLPFPRQNKIWKTTTLLWELQQNWLCPNLRGIWPSCRTLSRSAAIVIYIVFHWVCYTVQKDTVVPHLSPASQVQQATVLGERKRSTGRKKKHNQ